MQSYTIVNMKFLAMVSPPSIYQYDSLKTGHSYIYCSICWFSIEVTPYIYIVSKIYKGILDHQQYKKMIDNPFYNISKVVKYLEIKGQYLNVKHGIKWTNPKKVGLGYKRYFICWMITKASDCIFLVSSSI